ncbi:hypothetical protein CE91St41_18510 [Oscillospiraceae bacterium]|nr:hypothetical protein CE91St40_19010 [Oscillospiraceae bacterium]BDF74962.1 hypothetical protein CE91St41_18510 [Oscillospiraceae bacterium]
MGKIKDSKWTYVVLSLLMAAILWFYVTTTLDTEIDDYVRGVQVVFNGEDLLAQRGLMISEGAEQSLNLYVRAKRETMVSLQNGTVTVEVDVSGITNPGPYTQGARPNYTAAGVSNSQVNVLNPNPINIQFTVSRRTDRAVPVRGQFSGGIAEGHQMGEFSFAPAEITISGQEELVNQVDHVLVSLNRDNLSETFTGDMPFTLVDANGNVLEGLDVETNVSTVQVTLPVVTLKTVPLTVDIIPGGGATAENVELLFLPEGTAEKTITVSGSDADLEGLTEIYLGSIDLQKVFSSGAPQKIEFPVVLDPALTNVSGETSITVSVEIKGLAIGIIEVDNIKIINVPEGYTAESVTKTRQVQIRGTQEAVDAVIPAQLRIVADLTGIQEATGNQTWPVKVYLDGSSDVGVVGDYNITIALSQ